MTQIKLAETEQHQTKAHELAKKQREISVAEFFEKNRHLLGFDNKRKALLTAIKEAVDNSLDACEEARILPEISVEIIEMGDERYRVIIEDNGPGIVKAQVPNIFAKLLYGSKFHSLKQSRGQQGIGISAAALYGQLTTGRPIKITSKISPKNPAYYFELSLDTQNNKPIVVKQEEIEWKKDHGIHIELDLEGIYQKGPQSVDAYLKQTAIINPHATIIYTNPKPEQLIFPRVTDQLPTEPKEIKPHPYGIEVGMLIKMLSWTESRTLQSFFTTEFARVGPGTAKEICNKAGILPNHNPREVNRDQAERLLKAMREVKIIAPPTDCISPIGAEDLKKGLKKEINAEFYAATTRPPAVYRGNPFVIECAVAYGGDQPSEEPVRVLRFANRVPLLYQQGGCGSTDAIIQTAWRNYGLSQSKDSIPVGPCTIVVHMASVWVPFTSEAKEAIAHYPEIIKEIKLALQECGRELARYTNKKRKYSDELQKRSYIEKYIPHVGLALEGILGLKKSDREEMEKELREILERTRGELEELGEENEEYDEEFARIGAKEESEEAADTEAEAEEKPKKKKKAKDESEEGKA
ncbi:DNA topoisomerase VI subunit B [Candidatus Woesearchaeota archaeon]|nr:DNA topoisomerase VI subunit B [Candidatus Woesearchaeota archaeon]